MSFKHDNRRPLGCLSRNNQDGTSDQPPEYLVGIVCHVPHGTLRSAFVPGDAFLSLRSSDKYPCGTAVPSSGSTLHLCTGALNSLLHTTHIHNCGLRPRVPLPLLPWSHSVFPVNLHRAQVSIIANTRSSCIRIVYSSHSRILSIRTACLLVLAYRLP